MKNLNTKRLALSWWENLNKNKKENYYQHYTQKKGLPYSSFHVAKSDEIEEMYSMYILSRLK
jgi:hypothetical protein